MMRSSFPLLCALLLLASGCELVADFDRDKLVASRPDAAAVPDAAIDEDASVDAAEPDAAEPDAAEPDEDAGD
jgi:hypothetical protein